MSPKNDYIHAFLTDLKHHKKIAFRLRSLAKEHPELVVKYIENLPVDWEQSYEADTVEVLKNLEYLALKTLRKS